ncbi:hypothetical protein PINS_up010681 [Pythium insidiosum]|nr:hypothetical protein PINS_up010681 [Pythium insidiosum]
MMEADGAKKSSNWMRDQWVANLKKKRLAAAAAAAAGGLPVPPALPVKALQPNKTDSKTAAEKRTTKSGSSRASRSKKNAQKEKDNQGKDAAGPTLVPPMLSTNDKDALDLMHPAMFFQDLGSFEIESQSFTRLTPHGHSHSHHPHHHQHHAMMTATASLGDDSKGLLDPLDGASPSMSSR